MTMMMKTTMMMMMMMMMIVIVIVGLNIKICPTRSTMKAVRVRVMPLGKAEMIRRRKKIIFQRYLPYTSPLV